jgi:hypothetical protein
MAIGVQQLKEDQRITISGGVTTGGSFTLSYKGTTFVSNWNADLSVWGAQLQAQINGLLNQSGQPYFHQVAVIAANAGAGSIIFDIQFSGLDASRSFDQFQLIQNQLLPNGQINVFVSIPQLGGPINTIAPEIGVATTPPGGVNFFPATQQSPIFLPVLNPGEGFPLWVQRTVAANTPALQDDTMTLRFRVESLAP